MADSCEIGIYENQDPCGYVARYTVYVRSRHDNAVTAVDLVCGGHRKVIIQVKQAQYVRLGLLVPDMWTKRIGE